MRRSVRSIKLKHLNQSGAFPSGNARYYYRPKGQKGVKMPDFPMDSPRFLAAYAKAAGAEPQTPAITGNLVSAIALYKASQDYKDYTQGTKNSRRPILDQIAIKYGSARVQGLKKKHIKNALSGCTNRGNHVRTWRAFSKWAVDHYSLESDPSEGLKKKEGKTKGHIPWDEAEIKQFRDYWPLGSMERLAFELVFWTAARVSDAVRIGRGNVDKEGFLVFTQQKTGGVVNIPFDRELPDFAEPRANDLKLLHNAINSRNERHITYLHTMAGASRSPKSVSQWFAAKARKAGIKKRTAHGLRKSRAILLAELEATTVQIAAWTGHKTLSEVQVYIDKFNRRKVLTKTKTEQKVPTPEIEFQLQSINQGKSDA